MWSNITEQFIEKKVIYTLYLKYAKLTKKFIK